MQPRRMYQSCPEEIIWWLYYSHGAMKKRCSHIKKDGPEKEEEVCINTMVRGQQSENDAVLFECCATMESY